MLFTNFTIPYRVLIPIKKKEIWMRVVKLSLAVVMMTGMAVAGSVVVPPQSEVVEVETPSLVEIFGQSRTFYIDRTYDGSIVNNRNSLNTGGYIGLKSNDYNGFTAAIAAYGVYGFNIHSDDAKTLGLLVMIRHYMVESLTTMLS